MAWWGKALGGAFGFMLGGPLGALIGIGFGHNFDKGLGNVMSGEKFQPGQQERVQAVFFTATFSVMGHIAKADGKVTPEEIRMAEAVMSSPARKIFLPLTQEAVILVGVVNEPLPHLVQCVVNEKIKEVLVDV